MSRHANEKDVRNKPNRSRDQSSPSVMVSPSGKLVALNSNEISTDEETTSNGSNKVRMASHSSHTATTDGSSSSESLVFLQRRQFQSRKTPLEARAPKLGDPSSGAKSSTPKSSWNLLGGRTKPNRGDPIRKSSPSVLISPDQLTALKELEKDASTAEEKEEIDVKSIASSGSMKKKYKKWRSPWKNFRWKSGSKKSYKKPTIPRSERHYTDFF